MLKELTNKYIRAFNSKDIEKISKLLSDDFALEDPVLKRVEGKAEALGAIENIFNSCGVLNFQAKNIFQDGQTTMIEFELELDRIILTGVDLIEWEGEKMRELRAYLDIPKD